MAITYAYTKAVAYIASDDSKVTQWEVYVEATDDTDGTTVTVKIDLPVAEVDQKVFGSWTALEVRALADTQRTARWEAIADDEIARKRDRAIVNDTLDINA